SSSWSCLILVSAERGNTLIKTTEVIVIHSPRFMAGSFIFSICTFKSPMALLFLIAGVLICRGFHAPHLKAILKNYLGFNRRLQAFSYLVAPIFKHLSMPGNFFKKFLSA